MSRPSGKSPLLLLYYGRKRARLLVIQLILLSILLVTDILLVNWYQSFYNAVQAKNVTLFFQAILVFAALAAAQSAINGIGAFVSELHEAELRRSLTSWWRYHKHVAGLTDAKNRRLDQKIIDDPSLASERLAHVAPEMIYNFVKAVVFLFMLQSVQLRSFIGIEWTLPFSPLAVFGLIYVISQVFVLRNARTWIERSEDLKRKAEARLRYHIISDGVNSETLSLATARFISTIYRIRYIVARAHSFNIFSIHAFSLYSLVVPMGLSFMSYVNEEINFGELMKLAAIYAGFQNSMIYIFTFYKSAYEGLAALQRISVK